MGGKIATSGSDKKDKKIWHRSARKKIKEQSKELQGFFGKEEWIKEKVYIDYGDDYLIDAEYEKVPSIELYNKPLYNYNDSAWQDTYDWSSDGGSYFQYSYEDLVKRYNEELKDDDCWNYYVRATTGKSPRLMNDTWNFRLLVNTKNLAGKKFTNRKEMDKWMIKHMKYVLSVWRKIYYGK